MANFVSLTTREVVFANGNTNGSFLLKEATNSTTGAKFMIIGFPTGRTIIDPEGGSEVNEFQWYALGKAYTEKHPTETLSAQWVRDHWTSARWIPADQMTNADGTACRFGSITIGSLDNFSDMLMA